MSSITKKCTNCGNVVFKRGKCEDCFKQYRRIISKRYADKKRDEINRKSRIRSKNPENKTKIREYVKSYHKSSKYLEYPQQYHLLNKNRMNQNARERRKKDPIKYIEKSLKYYKENKEKMMGYYKKWRKKDPIKTSIIERNIRHKRRSKLKGTFTKEEWLFICDKYNNRCLCCGLESKLTVDHVKPISKGGLNIIDNIQPLCKSCNCKKRDKEIDYRKLHDK